MCGSVTERTAVSVVVPAYNVEKYIEQCVLSVLNQSYPCYELINLERKMNKFRSYIKKMLALVQQETLALIWRRETTLYL